jgi:hypothetical protein
MLMSDFLDSSEFFQNLGSFFLILLNGFKTVCYFIFEYGNIVLFFFFLFLGVNLLINAREKEEHDRIYARNLEYIKKRGRTGTFICILFSIAFLSKGLLVFLDWIFTLLPTPVFFSFEYTRVFYVNAVSWEAVSNFNPSECFFYFIFSLLSLGSIMIVVYGVYLAFFNKRILRTKFKSYKVLFGGLVLMIIYGVPTCTRLMI